MSIVDPNSSEGQQMIRNSAFEQPLTQGDPPPDATCSCADPSLNVRWSDPELQAAREAYESAERGNDPARAANAAQAYIGRLEQALSDQLFFNGK